MQLGNLTDYPYPSMRRVMMGKRGAVATSQPLATLAGMEMLLAGGNAVDAAIAIAIALFLTSDRKLCLNPPLMVSVRMPSR